MRIEGTDDDQAIDGTVAEASPETGDRAMIRRRVAAHPTAFPSSVHRWGATATLMTKTLARQPAALER